MACHRRGIVDAVVLSKGDKLMMTLEEIQRKAEVLGIEGATHMNKIDLVRAIQVKEGHSPCYNTNWCRPEWKEACIWRDECKAMKYFQ